MFAQLGTTQFNALKTFNGFDQSGAATYAEHQYIDGKPGLQFTGPGLNELSISFRLHASYCNPANELQTLKKARDSAEVLPLLWGNGVREGNFIISQISETTEDADQTGNVFSYIVNCSLKEFVIKNKLQSEQEKNRNSARATGNKKPVAKRKENETSCQQSVSTLVSKIENHAKEVNAIIVERGGIAFNELKQAAKTHLMAIDKLCAPLIERSKDTTSCVFAYPDIGRYATMVQGHAKAFNIELNNSPERAPQNNKILQQRVSQLKGSATPLITKAITRK